MLKQNRFKIKQINKYYKRWHKHPSHELWHWGLFIVGAFLLIFGTYLGLQNLDSQLLSDSQPSIQVADLNTYKHLADVTNQMLRNPTVANAQTRKQSMLNAMDKDPASIIAVSLDKKSVLKMPKDIQPILEQQVNLIGKPQVIIGKEVSFALILNNKTYFLHFVDDQKTIQDLMGKAIRGSTNIKVSGVLIDNQLIVPKGKLQVLDQPTGKVSSSGIVKSAVAKRLAVITYDLDAQGNANEFNHANTIAQETNKYFGATGSIASYLAENSYGKLNITGHVYGFYYNTRNSGGVCGGSSFFDPSTALYQQALADGYTPSNYDATWLFAEDCFQDGPSDHVVYEVAQIFGVFNNNPIATCTSRTSGAYTTFPTPDNSCTIYSYGGFGASGRTGYDGQYSYSVKHSQGWFDPGNEQTINTGGTYTIVPYELPASGVQVLRIKANPCTLSCNEIDLEYRQEIGFDTAFHNSDIFNGATVYYLGYLVDASPNGDLNGTVDFNGFTGQNIGLTVGNTLYDAYNGIQIKTLSANSSGLTVQVTYGALACVHNAATVSISPTPQWGNAGNGLNYTISVTNNDNSGCAASIFNITGNLPAGFTQNNLASISINPGQTLSTLVNVLSPATASGVNQFSEVATANGISGTGTANFNIATSSSSATFVKTDTSTGANWTGIYGTSGYLTRTANTLPSYVSESLISGFIDNNQPVWFNYSGDLTFDLNLTDGLTHQVAVYVTGTTTCGGMTGESMDVLDAANTSLSLDSRRITSFPSWWVWNMKGHVNLRFYSASNGCPTATGIFIDSSSGSSFSVNQSSLNFSGVSGGSVASQNVVLTNNGSTTTWNASTDQTWCHVNPTTGSLGAGSNVTLTISMDIPSNLGSFICHISVNNLTIAANYSVTTTLNLTLVGVSQITVTSGVNGGGIPIAWTGSFDSTRCSTFRLTGNTPSTLGIVINISGLATGNYSCTLTVTSASASNSPKSIVYPFTVGNPTTTPRTISVVLEGRLTNNLTGTVDTLSGSSLVKSYPITTDSTGNATINFDVALGTYTLRIKATPFLTRTLTVDLNSASTYSFPQLLTGDINQDGIVNSIDYSTLNAKWFTNDTTADLNQDGLVNSLDYSLLNKNWFVQGQ
jgi:hypothetical protein